MIRLAALGALLFGALALADEVPSNACMGPLTVGDSCLTDDGTPGVCRVVEGELICQAAVTAEQRSALPWVGAGLAFLALCVGVATRKGPVQSAG